MRTASFAHFILVGQIANRTIRKQPRTAAQESLPISKTVDLALSLPESVKEASHAARIFKYLFVFENFLRNLIKETLSENGESWWETKVPTNIQTEVSDLEETEETKSWMALGTRDKLSLATYPQLLSIIESCWKTDFEGIVRDKSLIQEARHIAHMRNAICHMTTIPDEEFDRIKQVMRDWFRVVSP